MGSTKLKILIMGLAGTGKTTLAKALQKKLNAAYFNADEVRRMFDDWEFTPEARNRQATRMDSLASIADKHYVIADFICPTLKTRNIFNPAFIVWMDTEKKSNSANGPAAIGSTFEQTDEMFEEPLDCNVRVTEKNVDKWVEIVYNKMMETLTRF